MGGVTGAGPFTGAQGYIEGTNAAGINPQSLYKAQLSDRLAGTTGVGLLQTAAPGKLYLEQNYPNPFNPSTIIRYQLPAASNVRLDIVDCLGRVVDVLADEMQQAGLHQREWNAARSAGGVYFYRLQTEQSTETRKLAVVK